MDGCELINERCEHFCRTWASQKFSVNIVSGGRNIHACTLGMGPGPKGPALMVVEICMVVIRITGSI